jgi:hypothetical protein
MVVEVCKRNYFAAVGLWASDHVLFVVRVGRRVAYVLALRSMCRQWRLFIVFNLEGTICGVYLLKM